MTAWTDVSGLYDTGYHCRYDGSVRSGRFVDGATYERDRYQKGERSTFPTDCVDVLPGIYGWGWDRIFIACPLSYLLMLRWISNFAYQTTISWWLFPLAGCVILLITMLTVIVQVGRAASRNPVTSLRYE